MPDFVYSTTNGPFITKIREHILPFECRASHPRSRFAVDDFADEKLKKFTFDMSKGPQPNIDLVPPPRWSHVRIPFNYALVILSNIHMVGWLNILLQIFAKLLFEADAR